MDWNAYDAVLFDLDGVLTPTARVHERAWAQMFTEYFVAHRIEPAYSEADYFAYVDGKPRYDGVRAVLTSRGIELPEGDPSDAPTSETVCGLGNRKNDVFNDVLAADGVQAYPGSLALMDSLEKRGIEMAVVSSSKNAPSVLAAAGIDARFDIVVDGEVAARRGLKGKPSGETYTYAASLLGSLSDRTVVVEDALSGVAAGRDGQFGLVVGVDRGAGYDALIAHGADIVVSDLAELVSQ